MYIEIKVSAMNYCIMKIINFLIVINDTLKSKCQLEQGMYSLIKNFYFSSDNQLCRRTHTCNNLVKNLVIIR